MRDEEWPHSSFLIPPYDEDDGKARPNEGVVDWLLACPEKGFFVPTECEST
jgi:hypothetical protein